MSLQNLFEIPVTQQNYPSAEKPAVDVDLSQCKDEQKPRMISLINRLAKSPMGLETLQIAKEGGFTFSFFDEGTRCCGACDELGKWIKLNPAKTDDKLVGTLCHEARHAGQFVRGAHEAFGVQDVKSELILFRAMEADAQTYAVSACHELRLQGEAGPYREFKAAYPEIESRFKAAVEKSEGEITHECMTETFKGWYDQKRTKTVYEESYQVEPMQTELSNLMIGKEPTLLYTNKVSGAEAVAMAGWTKEGNYFTDDPAVLESGTYVEVASSSLNAMKNFFKAREALTGLAPDPSVDTLPVRENGKALPKAKTYTSAQDRKIERIQTNKDRVLAQKQAQAVQSAAVKQAVVSKLGR